MSLCASCRASLQRVVVRRQRLQPSLKTPPSRLSSTSSTSSTASQILSKPTWSIRTLLDTPTTQTEPITPSQLHHLLRLSALPLPKTAAQESAMITTLQSQLRFVRAVQSVDTTGVEPLRAIRDETNDGVEENTVTLEDLRDVLEKEVKVGYYQRPRRVKERNVVEEAEDWDVLGTASKKAGRFFVVETGKKK